MEDKVQKRFVYNGFGFPVVFCNVPMVKARGVWTPNVDYNMVATKLVEALARKSVRLSGNEIRFVRHYFEMTLTQFGDRFSVSHPAVMKWEDAEDEPTTMKWSTEKDIRLFILDQLNCRATALGDLYRQLRKEAKLASRPVSLDLAA